MRKFRRARRVMREFLKKDKDLRRTFIEAIAGCIFETGVGFEDFASREVRNKIAERILSVLFGR